MFSRILMSLRRAWKENLDPWHFQHLSVPATSASAERIFSLAGRLYGDLTHNLSETNLEERMWAKINRHN